MIDAYLMYADGASRGNPGPASIGAVLYDTDGETVAEVSEVIGETTNNVAEYRALIAGLEAAIQLGVTRIQVRLDSLLLVRQIRGEYRVKAPGLIPLHRRVRLLVKDDGGHYFQIPRGRSFDLGRVVKSIRERVTGGETA